MKITVTGRQMEVSEDLKALFNRKLAKFDKFFRDDALAYITLSRRGNFEKLELTITSTGTLYRSEKAAVTFNNALDECIEAIERQIRKNKTRLEKRLREGAFTREPGSGPAVTEEPEFNIRTKTFPIKPMTVEEAILQMNLLGHIFYVFRNVDTEEANVVYKRDGGGYGLIIPQ